MTDNKGTDDFSPLIRAGLRLTAPRKKIYRIFLDRERAGDRQRCHVTAEEILAELRDEGEVISQSTVYRVLTQFEHSGLLLHHHFTNTTATYELRRSSKHHDHFVCLSCGRVFEFTDDKIELQEHKVAQEHDFRLTDHVMVLYGLCAECKAAGKKIEPR